MLARAQNATKFRLSRVDAEYNARKTEIETAEAESAMHLESIKSKKVALSQHADRQRLLINKGLANARRGAMLMCAKDLQTHTVEIQIQRQLSSLKDPQAEFLTQRFYEAYSKPAAHDSRDDDPSEGLPLGLDGNLRIFHSDVRNGPEVLQGTSTAQDAELSHDRNERRTAHQEALEAGCCKSIERDDDSASASSQHFQVDEPGDQNPTDSRLNEDHDQETDVIRGSPDVGRDRPPSSESGCANIISSEQRPEMLSPKLVGLSSPKVVCNPANKGLSDSKVMYIPASNGRRIVSRAEEESKDSISTLSRHAASPNRIRVTPAPEMHKEQVFRIQRRGDHGKIREVDWKSSNQDEDRTERSSHTMSAFSLAAKHSLPETKPCQGMSTSNRPDDTKTRKTGRISASNLDRSTTIRPHTGRVKDVEVDLPPYIARRSLFMKKGNQGSDSTRREGNTKAVVTGQEHGQGIPYPLHKHSPPGSKNKVFRTSQQQDPHKISATIRRVSIRGFPTTKLVSRRETGTSRRILPITYKFRSFRSYPSPGG